MSVIRTKKNLFVRAAVIMAVFALIAVGLAVRLWYLQIVDADRFKEGAYEQYTTEITVSPERGTIYDRNMTPLAVNATVETVFLSPYEIARVNNGVDESKRVDVDAMRSRIADFLSETLDVDRGEIVERMTRVKSQYQIVKKKVDRDTCDKIRAFIADEGIVGIHMKEDLKRVYPYGSLASHVIGFTNSENKGIYGVESFYESALKGSSGKIVTAKDASGGDMPFKYESYVNAENGANVVLTIDWEVQAILEKHLETAIVDTGARNRVFGAIVDVNTMEILAMSTKPDYDLNTPYTLDAASEEKLAAFDGSNLDSLPADARRLIEPLETPEERVSKYRNYLLETLWKNKLITEIYEPGSTFKLITSAMALEENVIAPGDTFYCSGSKNIGGFNIGCHLRSGHGVETFAQGLQNSCNPVFMELAARVGRKKFFNYFEAYGYTEKTGIDLAGEVTGIYYDEAGLNETELATASFGQTFKITPLQQIVGVSAVANGGYLLRPHVVKALVDDDGNVIKSFDKEVVRRVNSEATSRQIMQILQDGINVGSTKNAYVKGYNIAAKTGTSQKRDIRDRDLYIGSCVAFAPADDPQIAIIIGIDEPSKGEIYGGLIAAPVVSAVLTEVLPYLGIEPTAGDSTFTEIAVADYRTVSVESAKNMLTADGFTAKVIGDGNVVTEQLPRYGSKIPEGGVVVLYTDNIAPAETVTVPSVAGSTPKQAARTLAGAGLNIRLQGAIGEEADGSVAKKQSPEAGTVVKPGSVVEVEFRHQNASD